MVTTSPSRSIAFVIRVPLTNVPLLLLLSRISRPAGLDTSTACTRDASASSTTTLLVLARPTVAEPREPTVRGGIGGVGTRRAPLVRAGMSGRLGRGCDPVGRTGGRVCVRVGGGGLTGRNMVVFGLRPGPSSGTVRGLRGPEDVADAATRNVNCGPRGLPSVMLKRSRMATRPRGNHRRKRRFGFCRRRPTVRRRTAGSRAPAISVSGRRD